MARKYTHHLIGTLAGLTVYGIVQHSRNEDWSLTGALGSIAAGAFCAIVPDLLEPATNPFHRAFFHSATCAGVTLCLAKVVANSPDVPDQVKMGGGIAVASLSSHWILDLLTPMGLPPI